MYSSLSSLKGVICIKTWIALALGSGVIQTIEGVYIKKCMQGKHYQTTILMCWRFSTMLPFLFLFWVVRGQAHSLRNPRSFALTILTLAILEPIAQYCYFESIERAPLSLVTPFLGLTPILSMPSAPCYPA